MKRDRFGLQRLYYAADAEGSTIRELLGADRSLDRVAVDAHLRGELTPDRTMFAAVRQVPPSGVGEERGAASFGDQLRAAVTRAVETARRPLAVALSGGLDSAVVLALVHEIDHTVTPLVFAPNIACYSEVVDATATASRVGSTIAVAEMAPEAFVGAVPQAIAAFETPLYNLHPVSKWLLALTARRVGFASVISGDGADQLFRHDVSANYLPLVGAAFDAHGVALHTPFLDVIGVARDPDKRALREFAATLHVRDVLVRGPKVSQLAPPLPFPAPIERLGALLGRPVPTFTDDADRVRWGTLALLVDSFGAWR